MKNIAFRNLCGGFCGGVLGILAFGWVSPIALPIGCFVGVFIGFWHAEIANESVRAWQHARTVPGLLWDKVPRSQSRVGATLLNILGLSVQIASKTWGGLEVFGGKIPGWGLHFVSVRRSPLLLGLKAHPMNRSSATRLLATLVVGTAQVWLLLKYVGPTETPDDPFTAAILSIFPFLVAVALVLSPSESTSKEMSRFYRDFERYSKWGMPYVFGHQVLTLLAMEIVIVTSFFGAFGAILIGAVLLFLSTPFVGLFLFSMRALNYLNRVEYCLCLAVTLIVTGSVAWMLQGYLHGALLWIIALGAGALSGLATEAVRHALVWANRRFPWLEKLARADLGDGFGLLDIVMDRFVPNVLWPQFVRLIVAIRQ